MAASISGARACYPSAAVTRRGGRRCAAVVRSSLATCKPLGMRIGRQWAELQGARDWDGLLNPLDGALRGELVRYGEFVRAAYASFNFDGGAPSYGSCRFPSNSLLRRSGLPETGYRVARLLHAASTSAPCWLSCRSSYIGYVAVCDEEEEIERLGRRDVVIAFRGTATCSEWVDNFKLEESGGKVLRVVNSDDIVTRVPGFPDADDCGGARDDAPAKRKPRFPRWLVSKMGWEYSDVGRELRLCGQDTWSNVVASHDLDLYLKLVAACTY
uniref:Phospholipase A1 n=1 Tax=Oryza brachyantha TaxID=4533 RepID=J3NBC0_ORYBR